VLDTCLDSSWSFLVKHDDDVNNDDGNDDIDSDDDNDVDSEDNGK
jgi:hypothetical protein